MKVAWLHVAPVKGLRIEERDRIELGLNGVADDRLFCVVDETGRLLNGKRLAPLSTIVARYDAKDEHLELRMPNGSEVSGTVAVAAPIIVTIYGHAAPGHVVYGPWAGALSDELGRPVQLVRLDGPGQGHDRARTAAGATLRMLIGVSGTGAHEEDEWIGRRVRVGDAVVAPAGNVGRCVVTTRDPDTAEPTLDTLELLARYRRDIGTTEELAFGIWAHVEHPGTVRIGDTVEVEP